MKIKEAHTAFVLVSNLSRTLQQTAKAETWCVASGHLVQIKIPNWYIKVFAKNTSLQLYCLPCYRISWLAHFNTFHHSLAWCRRSTCMTAISTMFNGAFYITSWFTILANFLLSQGTNNRRIKRNREIFISKEQRFSWDSAK